MTTPDPTPTPIAPASAQNGENDMPYVTAMRVPGDPDHDPNTLILCATMTRSDGSGGYTVPLDDLPNSFAAEVLGGDQPEVGESVTVTFGLYTQRELDTMPEFDGW